MATLGWIGLGDMGGPMASRLAAAGHQVVVWARTPAAVAPLVAAGAVAAASPAAAAAQSEVLFVCVTDGDAVEAVVFGDSGASSGMRPGGVVVDHSTIHPQTTRALAERLSAAGASWVDAPVSGGVGGARAGTLSCFLGGEDAAVARVRPLIAAYCANVTHAGPAGAGQLVKSCNQAIVGGTVALWAETLSYARRCGLDPALVVDALAGGWADSAIRAAHGHDLAAGRFAAARGNLLLKDLEIIGDVARRAGAPMPVGAEVLQLYRLLAAQGYAPGGAGALIQLYDRSAKPT
jgi:3-hydroxyisobutyrate dehydrogenase-like beta-hydroxyacid dehydrogenase